MSNRYILSEEAAKDISLIFDYTLESFGTIQAIKYLEEMEELFLTIVINLNIGKERLEIKKDLRSILYKEHIIFYRIRPNNIRIIRVLHGSRDLPEHF